MSLLETTCYVFTNIPTLQVSAWSKFRGWNFSCGCVSSAGRLFFGSGTKLYLYGAKEDEFWTDADNAIAFDAEFPWTDFSNRMLNKQLRYLAIDTKGNAKFTTELYTDYIYKDANDIYVPYASMDFIASDAPGYGGDGSQPYGGGRSTHDARLFAIDAHFKILKVRIHGATDKALRLVALTFAYLTGSIR